MKKNTRDCLQNGILVLLSVIMALILAEGTVRIYLNWGNPLLADRVTKQQLAIERSGNQPPRFQSHPYLSYTPSDVVMSVSGCSIAGEFFSFHKPKDTLRIACLGGSTTMRAYPQHLAAELLPSFRKPIEVMDWGCAGWTMMESSINYLIRASLFDPDVVIVHHGMNDIGPRLRNTFQVDYAHYRRSFANNEVPFWVQWLHQSQMVVWLAMRLGFTTADLDTHTVVRYRQSDLYNEQPPETTLETYRNGLETIHTLTRKSNSKLILAGMIWQATATLPEKNIPLIQEHNQLMKRYAEQHNLEYVDLQTSFQHRPQDFHDASHLNRLGNRRKAAIVANAVATVMDEIPRIWVTFNEEPPSASLTIHWRFQNPKVESFHLYVQVNGGESQYLGQTTSANQTQLVWKSNGKGIAPQFRDGPHYEESYRFHVWTQPPLVGSPVGMYKDVILKPSS